MSDIEIACEVRARTTKALLIFDGKTEVWIPLSQISDYTEERDFVGVKITGIFITEWLANEKGLI
ncbi:MAG: hypothetical protein WCH44_18470 [Betaproteobacteria bacterium]